MTRAFLYKSEIKINDFVSIKIPTVGEILEDEGSYYNLVQLLTAMPVDLLVLLDDADAPGGFGGGDTVIWGWRRKRARVS